MCTKTVELNMRDVGIIGTKKCERPDYKDGLCKHHYNRCKLKCTNWGDRDNYKEATEAEMKSGLSMKLKNTHQHKIYQYRGVIKVYDHKTGKYIDTNLPIDHTLFCTKMI